MIKLYQNFTPNKDNHIHYIYDDFEKYEDYIEEYIADELDENNYMLNKNVLIVKEHPNYDPKTVTYCTWFFENKFIAFFVDNVTIQSGKYIYNLTQDVWATNIYNARFSQISVDRCNAKLFDSNEFTNVTYNDINNIKTEKSLHNLIPYQTLLNEESYGLCLSIEILSKALTDNISSNQLRMIRIEEIRNAYNDTFYNNINIFDLIKIFIKGISSASSITLESSNYEITSYSIKVNNAYIIPLNYIPFSGSGSLYGGVNNLRITSTDTNYNVTSSNRFKVLPTYLINNSIESQKFEAKDYNDLKNLNGAIKYVGTMLENIPLTRYVNNFNVIYEFIYSDTNIKLYVNHNKQRKEITRSIQLNFNENIGDNEIIVNAFASLNTTLLDSINQASSGKMSNSNIVNPLTNVGKSAIQEITHPTFQTPYNLNGDAEVIMRSNIYNKINPLFVVERHNAINTIYESFKTYYTGLNYSGTIINSFNIIENKEIIHPNEIEEPNVYIKCNLLIDNVNTIASNYILNEFNRGIFINKL